MHLSLSVGDLVSALMEGQRHHEDERSVCLSFNFCGYPSSIVVK